MVALLGSTAWMGISRLTRAEILSLQNREFIVAARAMGQHPLAILWRHLLPNAFTPVLIQATLLIGDLILARVLALLPRPGHPAAHPELGQPDLRGQAVLVQAWWIATFPGAAIAVTVIAFNLLADGLRDALDPRRGGSTPGVLHSAAP